MNFEEQVLNSIKTLTNEVGRLRSVVEANSVEWIDGAAAAKLLGRQTPRILKDHRDSGRLKMKVDCRWSGRRFTYRKTAIETLRDSLI